ncbi:hypothetical protein S1OALGB6SA_36 [Olavius algarvensis spirochete endosymbiont]|nr:hypothetical protein S1OALGB6SA_36 [Olavius algarvensis spirochete endosymbiont]
MYRSFERTRAGKSIDELLAMFIKLKRWSLHLMTDIQRIKCFRKIFQMKSS